MDNFHDVFQSQRIGNIHSLGLLLKRLSSGIGLQGSLQITVFARNPWHFEKSATTSFTTSAIFSFIGGTAVTIICFTMPYSPPPAAWPEALPRFFFDRRHRDLNSLLRDSSLNALLWCELHRAHDVLLERRHRNVRDSWEAQLHSFMLLDTLPRQLFPKSKA